jgi:Raf kinase inhibitor-like YbhB/YbcL family protein
MRLSSNTFTDNDFMPDETAFGLLQPDKQYYWGPNRNPDLTWSDLPTGTKSLALICDDLDVPTSLETFNKEGMTVSADLPRRTLCHWVLVDIPPEDNIRLGEFSDGVSVGGKPGPESLRGMRQGVNEYGDWFKNDAKMKGDYYGYDGPCPPWNDEKPHRYVFTLYALDVPKLPLPEKFGKYEVLAAMKGRLLADASITGLFTLNANVKK